jgi:hypothetical protein
MVKLFRSEIFKMIQAREFQRMVTSAGNLILARGDANKKNYSLIVSLLDAVKSSDFPAFVNFLTGLFRPYDSQRTNSGKHVLTQSLGLTSKQ